MLEPILQSLREVDGVQGALIVDPSAAVIAHRAHTIYDLPVLQQVARSAVNAIDSLQLVMSDWDVLTAHFGEGKLLLRNLRVGSGPPRRYLLTVIADATLNVPFLGVALRVAAAKLIAALESPAQSAPSAVPVASAANVGGSGATRAPSRSDVMKAEPSRPGGSSSSTIDLNDMASSMYLMGVTKALAGGVGPMAKVFVKEGVQKVCEGRPFSRDDGPALVAHLATLIDDKDDRAAFLRATRAL
jgi:predicted regulator of Ras-like GTPase activity (Roadblock/LC7/MglB family)